MNTIFTLPPGESGSRARRGPSPAVKPISLASARRLVLPILFVKLSWVATLVRFSEKRCRKKLPLANTSPRPSGVTLFIAIIVLSILIGAAGIAKLAGAKPLADQFQEFGLPKAMMLVVGSLEIAAAIGLNFRLLVFYAASGLVLLMLGAIANHVKVKHAFRTDRTISVEF